MHDYPNISGLHFRPIRDKSDYIAMHSVRKLCVDWDAIDVLCPEERIPSVKELADSFPLLASDNHSDTVRLVEINHQVIGYQSIFWWHHAKGTAFMHRLFLVPSWRNKGIEDAMLLWAETSIGQRARQHLGPNLVRTFLSTTEKETTLLFLQHGYVVAGGLVSLALEEFPVSQTPLPVGFSLKPIIPEHYYQIWEANELVFIDEPFRSPPVEENYQAFLTASDFNPALWSVIWADDAVAGVVFCEITPEHIGVISQLSVGANWRRRSLGRILVEKALTLLKERGIQKVYVATDVDNVGAIQLYANMNFVPQREFVYYQKPMP